MENKLKLSSIKYHQGAYITIEGKKDAGCFYIIQNGKVRISKELSEKGAEVDILGAGDFIGAVSAMSCHSQIESAQALSDVTVIKVLRDQYTDLIIQNPSVAIKIIMTFSRRLRYLNNTLAKLTLTDAQENGPSHLFNVGEYYLNHKQYDQAFFAYSQYLIYYPNEEKILIANQKLSELASLIKERNLGYKGDKTNRSYRKNTMIFIEGEPGDELFVIQKGSVKISKIENNKEVVLGILRGGDIFGEMALLENKPRLASVMAYEDCKVMAVNKESFLKLINTQPQLIEKITVLLADRIWFIYKKLANAFINDPLCRLYDAMCIQLEKNRVPLDTSDPEASYIFEFGWPELLGLAGLPEEQSKPLMSRITQSSKIQFYENRIHITSIMELVRQAELYRKIDARDRQNQMSGITAEQFRKRMEQSA